MKASHRWAHRLMARWFSSREPVGVILNYHRISDAGERDRGGPYAFSSTPDAFREEMRFVREYFRPVPPAALSEPTGVDEGAPFVVVTFDDGYRSFAGEALPILEETGVPAALFVCPRFLDREQPPYFYRLYELLESTDALELTVDGGTTRYPTRTPTEVQEAYYSIRDRLRGSTPEEWVKRLDQWNESQGPGFDFRDRFKNEMLTWEELVDLDSHPLVTVGSHGYTHRHLPPLGPEQQQREIAGSKKRLEERLGHRVDCFAYPFGDSDADVRERVRKAGYGTALATGNRPVLRKDLNDPYRFPRLDELADEEKTFWYDLMEEATA